MLLEFRCANHKSIKDEVIFSMIAGTDTALAENLWSYKDIRILPSAVIYGANGSGKTNFIYALAFMKELVSRSIGYQPGQQVPQFPHKLSKEDDPSEYSIQFVRNGTRYAYGFSIRKGIFQEEYLYFFPNGRKTKIFERDGSKIIPGSKYRNEFRLSLDALKDNRLFLSCAANFTKLQEIEDAFLFFAQDIVFFSPDFNNWTEYSIKKIQDDPVFKTVFLIFLKAFGTGITDVRAKLEKADINDLPPDIPAELRDLLKDKEGSRIDAKIVYDGFEVDFSEESAGIKRLFQLICPVIDILIKNKILLCDELECSLHESIIHQLVQLFNMRHEGKEAQLIFSTHNTNLLDTDIFRRDQIWFTQLKEDRSTDLYSLSEIRNVRKSENLAKGYMEGKYGAIPMLNRELLYKIGWTDIKRKEDEKES